MGSGLRALLGVVLAVAAAACGTRTGANGSENPRGEAGGEVEGASGPAVARLRLELRASRTVYAAGEALELSAWLVNGSAGAVVVLRRATHAELGLDAVNEAGEFITALLPPEPPPPPGAADLATIDPGGELELGDWELLQRVNEQIAAGNGRVGRFVLRARYHAGSGVTENLRELDPAAWVGSLTSNTLVIEIR